MRKVSHKMPVMEFGNRAGKVALAVGRRGRIQVSGKGVFTISEFATFLRQATWFHNQLIASSDLSPSGTRSEHDADSSLVRSEDDRPPTTISPQQELFGSGS